MGVQIFYFMYTLVVFIPLIGFLYASLFGFYFGREGISFLLCGGQLIAVMIAVFVFYEVVICDSTTAVELCD